LSLKTEARSEALFLAARLIQAEFLPTAVREKLGAYGAVAAYGWETGVLSFASYRDTTPVKVLEAFNESLEVVAAGNITDEMVERTIVRAVSAMDAPVAPGSDGVDCFEDEEKCRRKQERRTAMMKVRKDDVIAALEQLSESLNVTAVVIGGEELSGFETVSLV
jgi:Zn-dependent M16 (insulinase) family peptidase